MVLATDMSCHFTQIKNIKSILSLNETIDKQKSLSLILHSADIGHPSKDWSLHEKWTNLLVEEFFAQVSLLLTSYLNCLILLKGRQRKIITITILAFM
jgi:calcium/calmodulin-dependent 3',5'-cyclic nucleotide phosphodiesterase